MKLSCASDEVLERIVIEEFSRAERNGWAIKRDCDLTLARMVAVRLRKIARDEETPK